MLYPSLIFHHMKNTWSYIKRVLRHLMILERAGGKHLTWIQPFTSVSSGSFEAGNISWFKDGKLNVSVQCIDRHLETRSEQTAILWEGDEPSDIKRISYQELHDKVCQLANVLKKHGIKKGDRVALYMPMIPEAAYAMLACARIGAIHSVVFAGFSAEALRERILDSTCKAVITADEGRRGQKRIFKIFG